MDQPDSRLQQFFHALVSRPIAVLMAVAALLGTGVIATSRIPIELQPKGFASSRIWINAPWTGANPREVEQQVVRPLEEELKTVPGLDGFMSFASQGSGGVIASFPGTMDMDLAYAEIADRVERVRPSLPREVDRVTVRRWTTADMPILYLGAYFPPEKSAHAQDLLAEVLKPRLEAVDGVANVQMWGIEPRAVRIWIDEERARAANVDIGELVTRLQQDNLSQPVGDLDEAGSRFIVRVDGRFSSLEEIEQFPVRHGLLLKDIGRVVMARSAPEFLFRVNGQYSIGVAITKESSANTFKTCRSLIAVVEDELPADPVLGEFEYEVFWDAGQTIYSSLSSLVRDAAIGGLIACVVLMFFLRRIRYTLLIAMSIPFSVVVTLTYLYFTGQSFNLFTMMGITISIGMLVDNSVVIVESIFKRRERGESLLDAVTKGPSEVMLAVVTATLTTVVVFMPLIFMSENRNARLFTTSLGVPLCVSLLAALGLAIIIVPVASRYLATGSKTASRSGAKVAKVTGAKKLERLTRWSLKNRLVVALIGVGFLASGPLASTMSQTQMNFAGFGGEFEIPFELSANTSLRQAEKEVVAMEAALLGDFQQKIGDPTIGIQFSRDGGEINLWFDADLTPDDNKRVRTLLEEHLPERAAVEYKFEDEFDRQNTEDEKWLRVALEGPDSAIVQTLEQEVRRLAKESGAFKEVADPEDTTREVLVSLDRERMQRVGVTSQQVLGTIEWTLRGFMVSRLETSQADIPIIIEYDEKDEPSRARLAGMAVTGFENGATLSLASLAHFDHRRGRSSIFRQDGVTTGVVGMKPVSRDLETGYLELEKVMAQIEMPEGYRWKQAGGWADFQNDMKELQYALLFAIVLVFFLMGLLFEAVLFPLAILVTIPFAVQGATWAFVLSRTPIDIISMIGMIVLAGVVVNNGIVLLDRITRLRAGGMSREEAIVSGVKDRVRPVLMTALTTITGLLPIAFSTSTGDGFSFRGLAIGVAGGLACTTFFTLWMVPVAYSLLDDLGQRLQRYVSMPAWFRRRIAAGPAPAGTSGSDPSPAVTHR